MYINLCSAVSLNDPMRRIQISTLKKEKVLSRRPKSLRQASRGMLLTSRMHAQADERERTGLRHTGCGRKVSP